VLDEAVVFAEDFAELVVRDGVGAPVVGAGHGVCGDKGVVHGFFSGLDGGQEEEIDSVVDGVRQRFRPRWDTRKVRRGRA
jgi:hypothetical protein